MRPQDNSLKNKIKRIFTSMCARPPAEQPPLIRRKSSKALTKNLRQTILVEDLFVKRSRKNIVEEEFFVNQVLNLQMEKHLFLRVKGATVGLVRGEFSQEVFQGIKFPIFLESRAANTLPAKEQILSEPSTKFRANIADLLLYQTQSAMNLSKAKKNNEMPRLSETMQIARLLKNYSRAAANIVLVCSSSLNVEELSPILAKYADLYLFELENIRKNQELVCNVIYMASGPNFLRLNNKCFIEEIVTQLKLNIEEEGKITRILNVLIAKNYHKQVLRVARSLLAENPVPSGSRFSEFILRASEYDELRGAINECKDLISQDEAIEDTPILHEPTPDFGND